MYHTFAAGTSGVGRPCGLTTCCGRRSRAALQRRARRQPRGPAAEHECPTAAGIVEVQRTVSLACIVAGSLASAGCGDCVSLGTPAVYIAARDAATGQPVSLAGAEVTAVSETSGSAPASPAATNDPTEVWVCCLSGRVQLRVAQRGYAAWDTTVAVRTRGRCDTPVPVHVVARLRPAG
jgi:hypothetical protein